jgi:hypothetical protein
MDPRTRAADGDSDVEAEVETAEKQDQRLDEELAETFPASDPIPVRHDS